MQIIERGSAACANDAMGSNSARLDTRKLQPSAPSLVGMGRRQLQQDSLLPPNSTSNSSFAGASPPAPDSTVAGVPSAALPQSPFSAAPEAETSGFPPLSADFPEDLELGAPTESPLEVQTVADAPLASAPNGSIPAEPVTHVVLSPAGVASHEDGTAVLDTPPAVDGPVNGTADFPTPPAMYDNSNGTVGGGIPPAFNGSEVPAVPPSPETLIDTVFSNQIHEGHLRISVVVIIASLMMICGLGVGGSVTLEVNNNMGVTGVVAVQKRWFAEPEEDEYPLSPRGSYFILKARPGTQDPSVFQWQTLPTMSRDSLQGTMKGTFKKSLNHSLSVPRSSLAGGSARRTSNWGAGGIPATPGYVQTLPSASDALYSANAGWGWSSGGRELGRDLYRSMSDSGAKLEDDPNASTWPPAMSRVNRILSVLPEGAEEDERLMSTISRQSQMLPLSSYRLSPVPLDTAAMAANLESGITVRRCSDPFPVHGPEASSSSTPQRLARNTIDDPVGGQISTGHSSSGQGPSPAPALARICELGRMPSSEMTVVVDKNVRASFDDCADGLRYTGCALMNQHSPANKGACDAPWKDKRSSHAQSGGADGNAYRAQDAGSSRGASPSMLDDGASRPGSWHSMHSGRSTRSRDLTPSGTPRSDQTTILHATGAEHLGLKDHAQYQYDSQGANTGSHAPRPIKNEDRSRGSRAQGRPRTADVSPASDNAFDRLFSGPAPAGPLEAAPSYSNQLEAVCSLGAGSGVSAHAAASPGFAEEDMPHPPEPSMEPAGLPGTQVPSIHSSRIPRPKLGHFTSATAVVPRLQRKAFVRNNTVPNASTLRETQVQRLQSISLPRERTQGDLLAGEDGGAAYHVADRTESAGTQSSYDVEAIAKQAAASWRAGRAADGSAHPNKSASAAQNGGRSGGSTARKYVHEGSGGSQNRSGRALRHLSSMATSVHIRNSLALREQRVVHASRDPVCFSTRSRRRSHVGNSHTASALRNVIASTGGTPVLPDDGIQLATPIPTNRSISPRFRNSVAAITGNDTHSGAPAGTGHMAPFPSVPVSDYALTWLSKVRMSEGDAQQQPLTQRTTDTALAARALESSTDERDNATPSALPSAGHSCSSGSATHADYKGSQRFWGSTHRTRRGRDGSAEPSHPLAFGSSVLSPHRAQPTDPRMKRTASFGCQVEPQMVSREMAVMRNADMGRSVAGSLASTAVPSMLGSSAAASPMERSSHALRPTLSNQLSQPPLVPPPAPSNASNKHSSHDPTGFSGFSAMTDPANESAISSPTSTAIPRKRSDVRAPWPSMNNPLFGAVSGLGNQSTVYSSVRSDTLATESGMHDDKDAVGVTNIRASRDSILYRQSSVDEDCQNCEDTADAAPAVGLPPEANVPPPQPENSDTLPLLPGDGGSRSSSGSRYGNSGEGVPPKNAVKASIDSVRTSYGFVALGALAERCLRTSGGSLRGIRQVIQKVSHSHDGSIASELHMHATRGTRDSLDHSPSVAGFDVCNSVSPTAAARTFIPGMSLDVSGPVSAKSGRSVTLALLPDACRSSATESVGRAVEASSPAAARPMTSPPTSLARPATADPGGTGKACQMSSSVVNDDPAAVQRSAPCLQLLSPSPSPETQLLGPQRSGVDLPSAEGRRRNTS